MKYATIAAVAALATGSAAVAQDAVVAAADETANAVVIEDSFDDNRDYVFEDSFDDNRDYVFEDSFDDNSDNINQGVGSNKQFNFNGAAVVAESALSNVVTGVDVDYDDITDTARISNNLVNRGNSFRNYAGNNALNQNTGIGASQNASVTIAVSGDGFGGQ
ncbi:hypothetical protein [Qipengyuania sp. DGS5-3]|uniref:hypothetical protein n=1 Tax=Qipengyuania sp. DGS5-3 TaxID=3349632 RepID=UPI0036D43B31